MNPQSTTKHQDVIINDPWGRIQATTLIIRGVADLRCANPPECWKYLRGQHDPQTDVTRACVYHQWATRAVLELMRIEAAS